MDDDIIIKILKPVNTLPDLNQWNVISKIRDESYAQYKAEGKFGYYVLNQVLEGAEYDFNRSAFGFFPKRTLLHYAAKGGCEKVASALIVKGADISWEDREGYTPLDLAIESGNGELVELLRMKLLEKEAEAEALAKKKAEALAKKEAEALAKEMQLKTNKAIAIGGISGSLTALASAVVAAALFATGAIAVEALTILAAISIVAVAGLAVGGVTYLMLKPNNKINEANIQNQQEKLKP